MSDNDISYTVEEGFRVLISNLEISAEEYSTVSARQLEVETYLARYIDTFVTILPGAYARKTMIAPLKGNIVDMLVLLKQKHSLKYEPSELLEKLFVTLRHSYPHVEMSPEGKGIILGFPECTFNVMPGFFYDEGGYLVPALNGQDWIRSDPDHFLSQLERADADNKGLLLPVIIMLKCLNRSIGSIFNGYYLELLAMEILTDVPVSSHVSAVRHVLNKGKKKLIFRAEDPSMEGVLLDGLHDVSTLVQAMLLFQNAYGVSSAAVHHERRGNIAQAFREWGKIFPGCFPEPVSMVIQKLQESEIEGARALEIMRDSMLR